MTQEEQAQMMIQGCSCTLHNPPAKKSQIDICGRETPHSLPPRAPRPAFAVEDIFKDPTKQDRFLPSKGSLRHYLVGVEQNTGLWLGFNNNSLSRCDVAIQISMQGVNAISGRPQPGFNGLEQYRESCPEHKTRFQKNRFCAECGYSWPAQNYIATTGTPEGYLWLDGFRKPNGKVAQAYFTTDVSRGVAAQIIGNERVHMIGIGFYLSRRNKKPKPEAPQQPNQFLGHNTNPGVTYDAGNKKTLRSLESLKSPGNYEVTKSMSKGGLENIGEEVSHETFRGESKSFEKLEIGAGAEIEQKIYEDPEDLSYWESSPVGTLIITYLPNKELAEIYLANTDPRPTGGYLGKLKTGY